MDPPDASRFTLLSLETSFHNVSEVLGSSSQSRKVSWDFSVCQPPYWKKLFPSLQAQASLTLVTSSGLERVFSGGASIFQEDDRSMYWMLPTIPRS